MKHLSALPQVLACILLMVYMLAGTALAPFHGDESTQIYMSRDYAYLVFKGDWAEVLYSSTPTSETEQHLRLLNGVVNKYLIGLAWHISGFTLTDINDQWDWGADWNYNQTNGHAPSPELLRVARLSSAFFLAAGVPLMLVLGKRINGRWTGLIAAVLYSLHPALLLNGRRAMMEGSMIFFTLLTAAAAIWWLERRTLSRTLLLGAASGLAIASKHTALFAVAPVFAACLLVLMLTSRRKTARTDPGLRDTRGRLPVQPSQARALPPTHIDTAQPRRYPQPVTRLRHVLMLCIAGLIALAVFYGLNPAWWGDPITRAWQVLELRQELLTGQTAAFGGYPDFSAALDGFIRQVFFTQPQYYELPVWAEYIGPQISQYEASGWRGLSVGDFPLFGLLAGVMLLVGLWALARNPNATRWVLMIWALSAFAAALLFTPLEWQRYYLPAYPPMLLLVAAGVGHRLSLLTARHRARKEIDHFYPNA